MRERQNELTQNEQSELDRLSKFALDLAERNARYREHQRVLSLAKQKECEQLRQHAFRLDEQSTRERNIVKRKVLRWLALSYLQSAQAGDVGIKTHHIVVPFLGILVLCVAALLYACKMLFGEAPRAFADILDTGASAFNSSDAVGGVILALLLGAGALWMLWDMYRAFNR